MIAGSRGLLGWRPLFWIAVTLAALWFCQSSLVAMTALSEERTSISVGLASGFVIPELASDGPATLTTIVLLDGPPTMRPAIITSLPVSTCPRVEMLNRRAGLAAGAVTCRLSV